MSYFRILAFLVLLAIAGTFLGLLIAKALLAGRYFWLVWPAALALIWGVGAWGMDHVSTEEAE